MRSATRAGKTSVLILALSLAGCGATTEFTDIWVDPTTKNISFHKVLAVALTNEENVRRIAEDEMVKHAKTAQAVQSYTLFNASAFKDVETLKQMVKDQGFDGAVTMRLVGVDEQQTYVPGSVTTMTPYAAPYSSFYGYYHYYGSVVYDPGYVMTNKYVMIETNIYSVNDEKMLWSGRSKTVDPSGAKQLVNEVAVEAANVLRAQKLIK